jgi:RimJ/RimL family protein N-acetyltransferase
LDVEVIAGDDWKILQDVRLRALEDSPTAFLAKAETSWGEAEWRAKALEGAWVVARSGDQVIGVVHSIRGDHRPTDERHLESVWVDPLHRRSGVLRAILRYLSEVEPDVRTWMAWVLDGNDGARAAYERLGFETTGERQPLTDAPRRVEERLRLDCKAAISDSNDPGSAS